MSRTVPNPTAGFRKVHDSEWRGFFEALYTAYQKILKLRPDIIVVPLRGAEPLLRGIQLFASLERKSNMMPRACFLRIGEINKKESTHPYSLDDEAQRGEVDKRIIDAVKKIQKDNPSILLLDETVSGGSIAKNYAMVQRALSRYRSGAHLRSIAIAEVGRERFRGFNQLVAGGKIEPIFVQRLFTIDKENLLLELIRESRSSTRIRSHNIMTRLDMLTRLTREHKERQNGKRVQMSKRRRIHRK